MAALSSADHAFFRENGYILIRNAVPQANLRAVIELIWAFLGMDPGNPDDWYRPPLPPGGMVEVYQHQALWDNRQFPRVYEAFSEIYGMEALWVSIDRANLKPPYHPARPEYDHHGFIHWDVDTRRLQSIPFGVQGVLCLTETTEEMGGFQCVPGMHRNLGAWIRSQPRDRNPRAPELTGLEVKRVAAKAGDLIIWDRLLPHGNGRNISNLPRLAQYITMFPAAELDTNQRDRRIRMWRNRLAPRGKAFPGDSRKWERRESAPAKLTDLGRKLLGIDTWTDAKGALAAIIEPPANIA